MCLSCGECGPQCVQQCVHQCVPPCQPGPVDVTDKILAGEEFSFIPEALWHELEELLASAEALTTQRPPRQKLMRKRSCRVRPTVDYSYLEKRVRGESEFLQPKTYYCDYCPSDTLNVHVYMRHMRRHREAELRHRLSRCNTCGLLFNDVIQTKWHQLQAHRRR